MFRHLLGLSKHLTQQKWLANGERPYSTMLFKFWFRMQTRNKISYVYFKIVAKQYTWIIFHDWMWIRHPVHLKTCPMMPYIYKDEWILGVKLLVSVYQQTVYDGWGKWCRHDVHYMAGYYWCRGRGCPWVKTCGAVRKQQLSWLYSCIDPTYIHSDCISHVSVQTTHLCSMWPVK